MDYLDIFCERIQSVLAKQGFIEHLPENGCFILASFMLFTIVSWATYYLVAPSLIRYSFKVTTEEADATARLKWGHHFCAFSHSVVSAFASAYLIHTGFWSDSVDDRVWGHQPAVGKLFSFSMGYFLWDLCCCVYSVKLYGKSYLIHAIMALTACLAVLKPLFQRHALNFLPFEFSAIFINLHWMLVKTGYKKSRRLLVVDALGLLAYLVFRVIGGPYSSYFLLKDLMESRSELSKRSMWLAAVLLFITNALNYHWFYKLVRSYVYTFFVSTTSPDKTRRASRRPSKKDI